MRGTGCESLLDDVSSFCDMHDIIIPKMDELYFPGKSKRNSFELNDRFDIVSSDLLLGVASLNSANSFTNFDKGRIMSLAKCYPNEFDEVQIRDLSYQLDTFIIHMRAGNPKFSNLKGISDLAKTLVETNLVEIYSYVYLLVKLTLILPVATATVERAFSSMKQIKNEERNNMVTKMSSHILIKENVAWFYAAVNNWILLLLTVFEIENCSIYRVAICNGT
ncbi:uncharacterized protein [Nicotiana sylvestris]|uniref:uncharacterized protein n=1 Tax=Nicotiana sylvestris TaxID=4096 RepID=UPI00388C85AD